MLAHALNPSTWKAEADGSSSLRPAWTTESVPGQPWPHRGQCLKKTKRFVLFPIVCVDAWVCACKRWCPQSPRNQWSWSHRQLSLPAPDGCWDSNPGPLQEHCVLRTSRSSQPCSGPSLGPTLEREDRVGKKVQAIGRLVM